MRLRFHLDVNGERVYTFQQHDATGKPTKSAHPARFSPDDKFSEQRVLCKKRFGLLPTQQPAPIY